MLLIIKDVLLRKTFEDDPFERIIRRLWNRVWGMILKSVPKFEIIPISTSEVRRGIRTSSFLDLLMILWCSDHDPSWSSHDPLMIFSWSVLFFSWSVLNLLLFLQVLLDQNFRRTSFLDAPSWSHRLLDVPPLILPCSFFSHDLPEEIFKGGLRTSSVLRPKEPKPEEDLNFYQLWRLPVLALLALLRTVQVNPLL